MIFRPKPSASDNVQAPVILAADFTKMKVYEVSEKGDFLLYQNRNNFEVFKVIVY